ncbi:MAG: hypothetical protein KF685_13030, partial [Acidobacteria bacterium]|nr:hypothetical protein [Acidobacteriota bacterium]
MPTSMVRGICDTGENVEVEATTGTTQAGYATLGLAFMSINNGVHTGDIAVEICGSTTEAGSAVLNSSGAGAASYTAIQIYPLIDGATISSDTGQGRGVIELNGADNVTIDGDNPSTSGINRNLIVSNTSDPATNYTSVVRLVTSATVTSVDNVTVRNLSLSGSATGRNIQSSATSAVNQSVNTSFGILVGGQGPAVATGEPIDINSIGVGNVANSINVAATANNFLAENNAVTNSARAIKFWGRQTARSNSVIVRGNLIGNPNIGDVDGIYSMGISVQGSSSILVSSNVVRVESYLGTAIRGIEVGPETAVGAFGSVTVEKNHVQRVKSNAGASHGAYGINVSGGNGHRIQNNFVSGVINSQRTGVGLNGTTSAAVGIRLGAGNGHQVYHNTVHLYGAIPAGAVPLNLTAAFAIGANGQTGISAVNNIFSNRITGEASNSYNIVVQLPYTTIATSRNLT